MAARLLRVMKSPIQKTRIAPTKMYMVLMPATVACHGGVARKGQAC